ncbi:hypothetical protein FJTKL_03558 [Diaporthe vaccinii]|uniref:ATPase expression protein 2, mitochondrial n=1 Tax=Diaporthe vaccinii TaxID=105482 RepID=A0ABR4DV47_9PEZI
MLGFVEPPISGGLPHLWWVPTGPLTRFPLHAAGHHMKRSGETALDRVVSSYSPTIKSIIHTRQQRNSNKVPLPHTRLTRRSGRLAQGCSNGDPCKVGRSLGHRLSGVPVGIWKPTYCLGATTRLHDSLSSQFSLQTFLALPPNTKYIMLPGASSAHHHHRHHHHHLRQLIHRSYRPHLLPLFSKDTHHTRIRKFTMDNAISILLGFPPPQPFATDDDYDIAVNSHLQQIDHLFSKETATITRNGIDILQLLDPAINSISYLAVFNTLSKTTSFPPNARLQALLDKVASGTLLPHDLAVEVLAKAILRLDPSGAMLTSHHLSLVRLAYDNNVPEPAFQVKARAAFEQVITHPTRDGGVSKIMTKAFNKWVLVSLLMNKRTPTVPATTGSNASKTCKTTAKPYLSIAAQFNTMITTSLKALVEANSTVWANDRNTGLVQEVLAAHQKWQIINLRRIYAKVSLAELRQQTYNAETGDLLPSNNDVETLVQGMISSSMLNGVIKKPASKPPYLKYLSESGDLSEKQYQREITAIFVKMKDLEAIYKATSARLATNPFYIKQHIRESQRKKELGHNKSSAFDATVDDEDLMTGVSEGGAL